MDLKSKINELINSNLENKEHFVVELHLSGPGKNVNKITVLLDGDKGVSVEDCSRMSRKLGNQIEELNLIDSAYLLEVSSPGVDTPLQSVRQYRKNIGRRLSVSLNNEEVLTGKLEEVKENSIIIQVEIKEGKKVNIKSAEVTFSDIKKSNVLVSFN